MNNKAYLRRLTLVAALLTTGGGGMGYGVAHVAAATVATTSAPRAIAGTWVYNDARTVEMLRLTVSTKGSVGGDGSSTVKSSTDPHTSGRFTISVHDGRVRKGVLTLSLYVQQQFGLYYTAIEDVRCTTTVRVLHCHTHLQIGRKAFDSSQDFYRR